MNCDGLRTFYITILNNHGGIIQLDRIDIVEAAEAVRRSRKIIHAYREAQEFEDNFIRLRSKIPKSYFVQAALSINNE